MEKSLDFGLSPCPNDTFIFYHFIKDSEFNPIFLDIEELNNLALQEKIPLIKVSCATAIQLKNYEILRSGAAIGFHCGPILISNTNIENNWQLLKKFPVYIPGFHTTANFLFYQFCYFYQIEYKKLDIVFTRYDKIIPALLNRNTTAFGILIHEERFSYQNKNLFSVVDLGDWWQNTTQLPIPLGCIVLHKDLINKKEEIEKKIQDSILYSKNHYNEVLPFIKKYAQSMDDKDIHSHINLYVTEFSFDLKEEGMRSIQELKKFIQNI